MFKQTPDGVLVSCRVVANAKHQQVLADDEGIKIKVQNIARRGKANTELKALLEKALGTKIEIVAGATSNKKTLLIRDKNVEQIKHSLIQ